MSTAFMLNAITLSLIHARFMFPDNVRLLLHIIFRVFYVLWMHFTFLLLAFRKFLEPNRRFILKINSDVRGGFICRN